MIAYVTIAYDNDCLASYFVDYYSRLGITKFALTTYGANPVVRANFSLVCAEHNVKYKELESFKPEDFSHRHRQEYIKTVCLPGAWSLHADLDEFCKLPAEFPTFDKLCAHAAHQGTPLIAGTWLDRVGKDGKLVLINQSRTLDSQFPMQGRVRQKMGMNCDCVVATTYPPTSHHPKGNSLWKKAIKLEVHHFKWQQNLMQRLHARLHKAEEVGSYRHQKLIKKQLTKLSNGVPKYWLSTCPTKLGI
jgi:hypothetical protein